MMMLAVLTVLCLLGGSEAQWRRGYEGVTPQGSFGSQRRRASEDVISQGIYGGQRKRGPRETVTPQVSFGAQNRRRYEPVTPQLRTTTAEPSHFIPNHFRIIEDNRIHPENGIFSFDFKTENGIEREESGNEDLVRTGVISYPLPNGEIFFLKFVADATGYKPESPFLPVAPIFPHPIPPHALEQIRRGERERAEAAKTRANQSGEYSN